jgi:N-ethylmaleimide reductase
MEIKVPLLEPLEVEDQNFRNRVVMAPLTRRRATEQHAPTELMRIYYEQRASAGLIIAEATNISSQAVGYMNTPGIFTREQVNAWKPVTDGVHERGGVIFLQLWHVGRVSHSLLQPGGTLPVSSSAIKLSGTINTSRGHKETETPRALETSEISIIVNDYRKAARNAILAGFDGVEIHGANGYLPDQFLHLGSNIRTDGYGGSIKNRCRFLLEVTEACCREIGPSKVGLRLSPSGIFKDMSDPEPVALYEYLVEELNGFNLVWLHLMEPYVALAPPEKYKQYLKIVTPHFRKIFKGTLITNVGYNFTSGNKVIREGYANMVAFGKLFISNPDLVDRFKKSAPLNTWDESTFYYGGPKGYIDYPFLEP